MLWSVHAFANNFPGGTFTLNSPIQHTSCCFVSAQSILSSPQSSAQTPVYLVRGASITLDVGPLPGESAMHTQAGIHGGARANPAQCLPRPSQAGDVQALDTLRMGFVARETRGACANLATDEQRPRFAACQGLREGGSQAPQYCQHMSEIVWSAWLCSIPVRTTIVVGQISPLAS